MFFLINRFKLFIFLFLFFAILFSCGEAKAASYNANAVLGQTDYTHGDANQPNLTTGLNYPQGNVVDTVHHRLFVSDTNNNRVLVFLLNSSNNVISETPTYVIGQPNLSTVSGATTQNKLSSPLGLSYSAASNTLFVSDYGNTRIMVFDVSTSSIANGMNAIAVIGQTNFDSYDSYSYVPSEYSIGSPSSVEYDSVSNTLYVMDMGWNRITVYDINNLLTTSTPASAVIGQSSFTITGASAGQTRLSSPSSASFNSVSNTLYVTDKNNHRVLVFDLNNLLTTSTPASAVIGQANYTDNSSGVSQTTLNTPQGSAYNAVSNTLYVADSGNSRVLIYNLNSLLATSTPASAVIGEPNFDTGSGGLAQNLLYVPTGLSYNSTSNTLFINDYGNNRVVVFDGSGNVASAQGILGQPNYVNSAVNRANATNVDMNQVSFTAIDSVHHRLFVSDSANNRVLVFLLDSDNNVTTNEASYVIGQENFVSSGYAVSQGGLQNPGGLIYNSASNTLFVADYNNSRVMVFDVST
ncbi:MAG: NHL repeat-containing protein, partial [Candidatus Magasanikbacteria bacterium]|nr:NHL repeat-containing protein [Candidatus Magasanikbacteria bacterium]